MTTTTKSNEARIAALLGQLNHLQIMHRIFLFYLKSDEYHSQEKEERVVQAEHIYRCSYEL